MEEIIVSLENHFDDPVRVAHAVDSLAVEAVSTLPLRPDGIVLDLVVAGMVRPAGSNRLELYNHVIECARNYVLAFTRRELKYDPGLGLFAVDDAKSGFFFPEGVDQLVKSEVYTKATKALKPYALRVVASGDDLPAALDELKSRTLGFFREDMYLVRGGLVRCEGPRRPVLVLKPTGAEFDFRGGSLGDFSAGKRDKISSWWADLEKRYR